MQKISLFLLPYMCVLLIHLNNAQASIEYSQNEYSDIFARYINAGETLSEFEKTLVNLQHSWKNSGYKAVWFTLPTTSSHYIPILLKHGLTIHHASSSELVLIGDIKPGGSATLPLFAMQKLSTMGLVIDEDNNVLVVKERYKPELGYKLPGGAADPGEHISECAHREVKEETGINSEFVGIIGLSHAAIREGSQSVGTITFYCLMKPTTHNIQCQESEITEASWIPYNTFKSTARGTSAQFLEAYETGMTFHAHKGTQKPSFMVYTP